MNQNELKSLFKGQDPSARLFVEKMGKLPTQESDGFYAHAYSLGLVEWQALNATYQDFLLRLVHRKRQRFLEFLKQNMLGQLCYRFNDPLMAARVMALMEPHKEQKKSNNHQAFCFQLGFESDIRLETMGKIIGSRRFMPEELQDLKGKAIIDTGEVDY